MAQHEQTVAEHEQTGVRIEVLPALCRAHGRCYKIAPGVFEKDEFGFPWLLGEEVPPEHVDRARKAVYACPSKALLITTG